MSSSSALIFLLSKAKDMEYRIETWTLSGLHETNKLGSHGPDKRVPSRHQAKKAFVMLLFSRQFPIGKEEQIKAWQQKDHTLSAASLAPEMLPCPYFRTFATFTRSGTILEMPRFMPRSQRRSG